MYKHDLEVLARVIRGQQNLQSPLIFKTIEFQTDVYELLTQKEELASLQKKNEELTKDLAAVDNNNNNKQEEIEDLEYELEQLRRENTKMACVLEDIGDNWCGRDPEHVGGSYDALLVQVNEVREYARKALNV